jgi:lysophospholipase L1-like esterase
MLPISAVQGLRLRKIATRLPGAAGKRQGSTGKGDSLHLLAIGDSIIDGVGTAHIEESLPVQFATALSEEMQRCVHWRVEGETGFDIDDVLDRLNSMDRSTRVDLVLISVGVNDVTGLSSTRHWRGKLVELLDRLGELFSGARIIFAGLPPMSLFPLPRQPLRFTLGLRSTRLDRIAAEIITGYPNAIHVPTHINPQEHGFSEDGFHPSAESCTLWARELAVIESRRESV